MGEKEYVKREPTPSEKDIINKINVRARRSSTGFNFTIAANRREWFEALLSRNGLAFGVVRKNTITIEKAVVSPGEHILNFLGKLKDFFMYYIEKLFCDVDEGDDEENEDTVPRVLIRGHGVSDLVEADLPKDEDGRYQIDSKVPTLTYVIARDNFGLGKVRSK